MNVLVSLNVEFKIVASQSPDPMNIRDFIGNIEGVEIEEVFGRGQYARVETDVSGYERLKTALKHNLVFSPILPFSDLLH